MLDALVFVLSSSLRGYISFLPIQEGVIFNFHGDARHLKECAHVNLSINQDKQQNNVE